MTESPHTSSPDLEARLGYRFRDPALLDGALTHASAKSEERPSNERLEFLGDAVLGLVVAHFLYWAYEDVPEGQLTRLRASLVSTRALARLGRDLDLERAVHLGKGLSPGRLSEAVLANVVEALFGAVYLDGGLEAAREVILWLLAPAIEAEVEGGRDSNWKSRLQELTQQRQVTPTYEVLEEAGPPHQRTFVVAALVDGVERGRGHGASKKDAAQAAARAALMKLMGDVED